MDDPVIRAGHFDGVATVDHFVATHWGMKTYDYGPSADSSPFLTRSLQDAIAGVVKRLALSGPAIQ